MKTKCILQIWGAQTQGLEMGNPRTSLGCCFQPGFGVHPATFIQVRAGLEGDAAVGRAVVGGQESIPDWDGRGKGG